MAEPRKPAHGAFVLTDKGIAVTAFIDSGLAPKTENGYDIEGFERFWDLFQERKKEIEASREKHAQQKREEGKKSPKNDANYLLRFFLLFLIPFMLGLLRR